MSTATKRRPKATRPKTTNKKQSSPRGASKKLEFGQIFKLAINNKVERHPDNRHPTPEAIARRAESFKAKGQLEPIQVRMLAGAKFQILSGETRFLAAKRLKWKEIDARSVNKISDAEALQMVAAGNIDRDDLNPVERAKLVVRLTSPIEDGGAGLSQAEAGDEVGLTRSTVSNVVRLLKLPEEILDRVASGLLPDSYAREFITVLESRAKDRILKIILKKVPKNGVTMSRDQWVRAVRYEIQGQFQRIQKPCSGFDHYLENPTASYAPTFFKLTPELEESLGVFKMGQDRYCKKSKQWETLNKQAAAKKLAKKKAPGQTKGGKVSKLSAVELKRRENRAEVLQEAKIEAWRSRWLRELIAEQCAQRPSIVMRFVHWMALGGLRYSKIDVADWWTNKENPAPNAPAKLDPHERSTWILPSFDETDDNNNPEPLDAMDQLFQHVMRSDSGDPERPIVAYEMVDSFAKLLTIEIFEEWAEAPFDTGGRRHQFLLLLNSNQLDQLATEWGPKIKADVEKSKTKAAKVDYLRGMDKPLPSMIRK